ncbi:hypothetical protein GE09DRAFT_1191021 [Coniochaeta sp. 2T2.1]|nr:hypothetical protein GE09DRAFT_1191021 [Coniochaeta sp. 2T2.1]
MDIDSDASLEASVFEQEPISGAVLLDQELLHRETFISRGNIFTGCAELDEDVLIGGLERGRVMGLSAEEGFGLLLGLQTIARLLVSADEGDNAKAMIITTLSHAELLPTLRGVVKGQVDALHGADDGILRLRAALERISISRVFDFDGLREALDELDLPSGTGQDAAVSVRQPNADEEEPASSPQPHAEAEIRDSEDDEPSSSGSSSLSDPPPSPSEQAPPPPLQQQPTSPHPQASQQQQQQQQQQPAFPLLQQDRQSQVPDIVLITNLTTLITSLYTTRDRKHAHRMLRHLTSKLRYLSRSPSHGCPLFILLNSTTSKSGDTKRPYPPDQQQPQDIPPSSPTSSSSSLLSHLSDSPPHSPSDHLPLPIHQLQDGNHDPFAPLPQYRTEDSSDPENEEDDLAPVRSLFNPPPPRPGEKEGEVDEYGYARHPNPEFEALTRLSRRNKPFFGLRFDVVVELHLLATRVPKREEEGDGEGEVDRRVETVWVVEVLGDRRGIWAEGGVGDEDEDEDDGGGGGGYEGIVEGEGEWDENMEGEKQTGRRMGRRFYREQRWAGVKVLQEGGGTRIVDAG